jgi:hypothetical protein
VIGSKQARKGQSIVLVTEDEEVESSEDLLESWSQVRKIKKSLGRYFRGFFIVID